MGFMRCSDVVEATGLSRSTLWRLERAGNFPKRRRLSPGRVAWRSEEIDAWRDAREPARSDKPDGGSDPSLSAPPSKRPSAAPASEQKPFAFKFKLSQRT